jgi:hypothetical protein
MAGKMSPGAQVAIALLEGFVQTVGRINSLVEQFAVAKQGHETLRGMIKREAGHAKLRFMTSGLGQLSQQAGAIEMAAARGGSTSVQARTLRELTGSLKFQLDFEMRTILREDAELQMKKKREKEASSE